MEELKLHLHAAHEADRADRKKPGETFTAGQRSIS